MQKPELVYFKNLLEKHWASKAHIYMKAFCHKYNANSSFLKSLFLVSNWATIEEIIFTCVYQIGKIFQNFSSQEPQGQKSSNL
jgi:hypothetical protein